MAIFRKVHTSIWGDSFFSELDKDKKLFYLYLLTNERTKQCGVYEITKKQISFDIGYTIDRVSILIKYFIKVGKIRYNDKTNELALGNWLKYNSSTSPKVQSCINKEFADVKDTVLIEYVKSMDTRSQEEQEEEQEEEKYINVDFKVFWNLYGKKVGDKEACQKKWKSLTDLDRKKIIDTLPAFKTSVSDKKYLPYPAKYLNQKRWKNEDEAVEQKDINEYFDNYHSLTAEQKDELTELIRAIPAAERSQREENHLFQISAKW